MGTCEDMCPAAELAQRRRIEDIAQLERLRPDQRATDASMAVKKFSRNVRLPAPDLGPWHPTPGSLHRCIRDCGAAPLAQPNRMLSEDAPPTALLVI